MGMHVQFAFGKGGLHLELPEGMRYEILQSGAATPLVNVQAALAHALDTPLDVHHLL
jgi:hypothetical protein